MLTRRRLACPCLRPRVPGAPGVFARAERAIDRRILPERSYPSAGVAVIASSPLTGGGSHGTIGRHGSIAPAAPAARPLAGLAGPREHGLSDGGGRGGLAALRAH